LLQLAKAAFTAAYTAAHTAAYTFARAIQNFSELRLKFEPKIVYFNAFFAQDKVIPSLLSFTGSTS
jgi:hypothetical protein